MSRNRGDVVVSVSTTSYYVDTDSGLQTSITNAPLHTVAGNNGVYGPGNVFPGGGKRRWDTSPRPVIRQYFRKRFMYRFFVRLPE